jgi:cyclopropane-fatty-acyl-phospholipid synthase
VLQKFLIRLIRIGRVTIIGPDGSKTSVGRLPDDEPHLQVTIRLKCFLTPAKLLLNPDLYLGECYMNGDLLIEQGTLWDLLNILGRNLERRRKRNPSWQLRLAKSVLRRWIQLNSPRAARRNVAHHYDLSDALYRSFLDPDLQYSCAYFPTPATPLVEAQSAKKKHIAEKLLLEPGQRVLDIGCGWGGLALTLAQTANVQVLGITLSPAQLTVARQRAHEAGLASRVTFELRDYREIEGTFDRIVSVGMFEHVGTPYYGRFFETVASLLNDDGLALIHSIGRKDGPDITSAWIRKYIFPGGYIPALSEVLPAIERSGLWLTDIEILRVHYAKTLRYWRERFLAHRGTLSGLYDERFFRMWEFYLAVSEMSFRHGGMMVFQAQLSRRIDAVPLTRSYISEHEGVISESGDKLKNPALLA